MFGLLNFLANEMKHQLQVSCLNVKTALVARSLSACGVKLSLNVTRWESQRIITRGVMVAINTGVDRVGKMFHQSFWILIVNVFHTHSDSIRLI